jgi:hypothetical protein
MDKKNNFIFLGIGDTLDDGTEQSIIVPGEKYFFVTCGKWMETDGNACFDFETHVSINFLHFCKKVFFPSG